MKSIFIIFYFSLLGFVSLYGIHLYWLITIYLKNRHRKPSPSIGTLGREDFPYVTVQLPIYNEKRVALRLVEAVAKFDWPADKLEIQIMDDSTDETSELIASFLQENQLQCKTTHIQRTDRTGFKAGALANGMKIATGEFIAIFDADNAPRSDFLMRLVPYFNDESIAMVQSRWSFLNRNESILCAAQGLFLDAHFHIEQQARFLGGLLFNFNGTAGIWRKKAIYTAGGWQHDTLTEDLDLSIRAQLAGWKFIYDNHYDVPSEIPNSIAAFKSQQYRWSKGAIQTGLKLIGPIFKSTLPMKAKIAAVFHFSSKALSLALLFLALLLIPALHIRLESGMTKLFLIDLPIFLAGTGSMSIFYSLAYRADNRKRNWHDMLTLPMLTSLGIALAVNNSRALLSALLGHDSPFVRTPKSGSTDTQTREVPKAYHQKLDRTSLLEIALAVYSAIALFMAVSLNLYFTIPFLLTFFVGYLYFSVKGLTEAYAR